MPDVLRDSGLAFVDVMRALRLIMPGIIAWQVVWLMAKHEVHWKDTLLAHICLAHSLMWGLYTLFARSFPVVNPLALESEVIWSIVLAHHQFVTVGAYLAVAMLRVSKHRRGLKGDEQNGAL